MMKKRLGVDINRWVILGVIGIIILLCIGSIITMSLGRSFGEPKVNSTAELVVIPAPSITPTLLFEPTLTPTIPFSHGGIKIGDYVQISGTEGAGLRIRSGAGTNYPPVFSGFDSEVFLVKDGPEEADDFVWWYLVAPYDESRSGWAASEYLTIVEQTP